MAKSKFNSPDAHSNLKKNITSFEHGENTPAVEKQPYLILKQKERIEQAYNMFKDILYNYLYKNTYLKDESFDILQETFICFVKNIEKVREGKEKSWLFQTARNIMMDKWRKNKNIDIFSIQDKPGQELEISDEKIDIQEDYIKKIKEECINAQIDKLPARDKEIIIMKYQAVLKTDEIARITGLTADNINVRLHRNRKLLKTYIIKYCL